MPPQADAPWTVRRISELLACAVAAASLALGACSVNPVGGPPVDGAGDASGSGGTGSGATGGGESGGTGGVGSGGGTGGDAAGSTDGGSGGSGGRADGTGGGSGADGGPGPDGRGADDAGGERPQACADVTDCDDSDACTVDTCDLASGTCGHTPVSCADDGIPCSVESCDPVAGCASDTSPCECLTDADCADTLACNGVETCAAWACQDGAPIVCDDGLPCTDDVCVEGPVGSTCQTPVKSGRCLIAGACYVAGDTDPEDPCAACAVDVSTASWTDRPIGSPCLGGTGVCGDAGCELPPATLPAGMVWVPEGDFEMGCNNDAGAFCDPDELPVHTVFVSGFAIDALETSVAAYTPCEAQGACETPDAGGYKATFGAPGKLDHPVNYVSWDGAVAYCTWRGARLCTEAEWERAARGGDGRTYPWGEAAPSCELAHLYLNAELGCGSGETAPVGSHPAGKGPYGTFDQGGNVWEYVADYHADNTYSTSPTVDPQGPPSGSQRVVRGGSWKSSPTDLSTFRRHVGHSPHEARGIRCCWSPE